MDRVGGNAVAAIATLSALPSISKIVFLPPVVLVVVVYLFPPALQFREEGFFSLSGRGTYVHRYTPTYGRYYLSLKISTKSGMYRT